MALIGRSISRASRRRAGAARHRPPRRRAPLRRRLRHLLEEASLHIGETFAELADWIRIGR